MMNRLILSGLFIAASILPVFSQDNSPALDPQFGAKQFSDPDGVEPYIIQQSPDGGFYLAGNYGLIRLDAAENKLWSVLYPASDWTSAEGSIAIDTKNNVYAGVNMLMNSAWESHILKYNSQGNLVKDHVFPIMPPDSNPAVFGVAFSSNSKMVYATFSYHSAANNGEMAGIGVFDEDLNLIKDVVYPGTDSTLGAGMPSSLLSLGNKTGTCSVTAACTDRAPGSLKLNAAARRLLKVNTNTGTTQSFSGTELPAQDNMNTLTAAAFMADGATDTADGVIISSMSVDPSVSAPQGPLEVVSQVSTAWGSPVFSLVPFYGAAGGPPIIKEGQPDACGLTPTMKYINPNPALWGSYAFTWGIPQGCLLNNGLFPPWYSVMFTVTLTVSVSGTVILTETRTGNLQQLFYGPNPLPFVQVFIVPAPPPAAKLTVMSGNDQAGTVTKALPQPLAVQVQDASGNPKSGVPVTFSISGAPAGAAGQGLSVLSTTTSADGSAPTEITLGNRVGTYTVTAACSQCSPSSVTFNAQGKLFLGIALSTPTIMPLMRDGVVRPENTVAVLVSAFGVGGTSDTVSNYPVVLKSTDVALSGGHDHENGHRPVGVFTGTGSSEISGVTGDDGRFMAVYRSSWTGGFEILTASSTTDGAVVSTSAIVPVKIIDQDGLDLFDISTLPLPFIRLTGNTGTTSYKKCAGQPIHHASSHWITGDTISRGIAAIIEFNDETGIRLGVNDMSLPFGGIFDICGNWQPAHACHRGGNSVDIDKTGLSKAQIKRLTAKMRKYRGERVKEATIHYQFPGREKCFGTGGI